MWLAVWAVVVAAVAGEVLDDADEPVADVIDSVAIGNQFCPRHFIRFAANVLACLHSL